VGWRLKNFFLLHLEQKSPGYGKSEENGKKLAHSLLIDKGQKILTICTKRYQKIQIAEFDVDFKNTIFLMTKCTNKIQSKQLTIFLKSIHEITSFSRCIL
jgi:hypothetical protein